MKRILPIAALAAVAGMNAHPMRRRTVTDEPYYLHAYPHDLPTEVVLEPPGGQKPKTSSKRKRRHRGQGW